MAEVTNTTSSVLIEKKIIESESESEPEIYFYNKSLEQFQSRNESSHSDNDAIPLYCEYCNVFVYDWSDFDAHVYFDHKFDGIYGDRSKKCGICGFSAANRRGLFVHKQSLHALVHKCVLCDFESEVRTVRNDHMKNFHETGEAIFECGSCEIKFTSWKVRNRHMNLHTFEVSCNYCAYQTKDLTALRSHMLRHSRVGDWLPHKCDFCEFVATSREDLCRHSYNEHLPVAADGDAGGHTCDVCMFYTVDETDWSEHVETHRRKEKCKFCEFMGENRKIVFDHVNDRHWDMLTFDQLDEGRELLCEYCGVELAVEVYESHLWDHTGEMPLKCGQDGCHFRTDKQHTLRNHHKQKHGVKKAFCCNMCKVKRSTKEEIEEHKKEKHPKGREHKCEHCPYVAAKRWTLKVHMRRHTGEKPYQCRFCDYRVAQKWYLPKHEESHNEIKKPATE